MLFTLILESDYVITSLVFWRHSDGGAQGRGARRRALSLVHAQGREIFFLTRASSGFYLTVGD